MKRRSVVVHGHFYQPPREDPWTGRVPLQPSAAPHHDWNERVHDECYRAVVAARVLDGEGRIKHVMNTLEWISWDAGPTLLEWMATERPGTYRSFLAADRRSRERTGHGNALATPYHHVILPLASRREKVTEVRWGIDDFRRRFGREPEGMWLPETAVDTETLDVLARAGILFTVLGPGQVVSAPAGGLPGRVDLPGGRSIAVFVYDGPQSHDVAFGALLGDAGRWVDRIVAAPEETRLISVATDGETFGHHHRFGEMALAAMLTRIVPRRDHRVENYASFLARRPPREAIELVEPSSWSCVHGVERWRGECGCRIDPSEPTSQAWRTVLREALDELADELHERFAAEGGPVFGDPWAARDAYGAVQDASDAERRAFLARHVAGPVDERVARRAFALLETQRNVLRMYTSCAWFFDDVARLEPLQNLRYAAHALDLLGEGAGVLEQRLVARLAAAASNDPEEGDAARLWRTEIRGSGSPPPGDPVGDPAVAGPEGSPGVLRAVRRALADPGEGTVSGALAALDAASDEAVFEAQTVAAAALARGGARAGSGLDRLTERLGIAPEVSPPELPAGAPLRFVFGVHLHQPVGNFDDVFQRHVDDVYLPFLERSADRGFLPLTLHVSGPLLEWLEGAGHAYLDLVARLVAEGSTEMLLSGFYEPVLPALDRRDRLEQIGWMRDWLRERFGAEARGLWLTERVWEPGLAADLADAGVEYVLLDDRHFLVAGHERGGLDRPWRTESDGRALSVLPIDEHLRYLIPFRSPGEIGAYLRRLASAGNAVAVLADDGEKFGGWPGTADWVWKSGWLESFFDEMEGLAAEGVVRLTTPSRVLEEVRPAGLAYLPSASYREMEEWSLPPRAAATLQRARWALEHEPAASGALRGGHWRNFLARYDESNRMHKKAQLLSGLCRDAGDPDEARRAIGRAQCNDVYWHGVFGGLYLRHLRGAVWANLAEAERILRRGQGLVAEWRDVDGDGTAEVGVHSSRVSAVVQPHRGGRLVELVELAGGANLCDVLTRRREAYHRTPTAPPPEPEAPRESEAVAEGTDATEDPEAREVTEVTEDTEATEAKEVSEVPDVTEAETSGELPGSEGLEEAPDGGMPSIHELEERLRLEALPPVDLDVRALFVDRVLEARLGEDAYAAAEYEPLYSWAEVAFEASLSGEAERATISMAAAGVHRLEKVVEITDTGSVEVSYRWDPAAFPRDAYFAPELSVAFEPALRFDPEPDEVWRHDIVTLSKSESGFEESVQGASITPRWHCRRGRARIALSLRV